MENEMTNRQCPRCHKLYTGDNCSVCILIRCGYTILNETYCIIYYDIDLKRPGWTFREYGEKYHKPLIAKIDDCYNYEFKYMDELFTYPVDSVEQAKEVINTPEFKKQELAWKMK